MQKTLANYRHEEDFLVASVCFSCVPPSKATFGKDALFLSTRGVPLETRTLYREHSELTRISVALPLPSTLLFFLMACQHEDIFRRQ